MNDWFTIKKIDSRVAFENILKEGYNVIKKQNIARKMFSRQIILWKRRNRTMIILIAGASHTGKTVLAQKILEKYKITYLSIDHLKMGLIRSGNTELTPEDDEELVPYLWSIVKEIIKTAIENHQNLVVEGGYIPFDWKNDFDNEYLEEIQYYCLVMSKEYIKKHFSDVKKYANTIESRLDDSYCTVETMIEENTQNLQLCKEHGCNYILIEDEYKVDIEL